MSAAGLLEAGQLVAGRYLVERQIGAGRSAKVFAALDRETSTRVALKALDPFLAGDPVFAERFLREAQVLRSLDHPNIVKVYDLLDVQGTPVLCMEYVEGVDGKAYLHRYGKLPLARFLPLARALVAALETCHRVKVLHRDVKPGNVLVGEGGQVKLVDFGIARLAGLTDLTKTGTLLGTPEYLAPECFRSARGDPRSDVYGLGATLYEFLTGRPPFVGSSLAEVMERQMRGLVEPIASVRSDVPVWLERVVQHCLCLEPGDRCQSCYELRVALERGAGGAQSSAPAEPVSCAACSKRVIPGVGFCHHCGSLRRFVYEKGAHSVILESVKDRKRLKAHLGELLGPAAARISDRQLQKEPLILVGHLSSRAANELAARLHGAPCQTRVLEDLASRLQVPIGIVAVSGASLVPLLLFGASVSTGIRIVLLLLAEAAVFWAFRERMRPAISAILLEQVAAQTVEAFLRDAVTRLVRLPDESLRALIARVVQDVSDLRAAPGATSGVVRFVQSPHVLQAAIEGAQCIGRYEVLLSAQSYGDLRERVDTIQLRLNRCTDVGEQSRFVAAKVAAERDLKNYRLLDESYSETYAALLNVQAGLRRVCDEMALSAGALPAHDELQEIVADLESLVELDGEHS